MASGRRPFDPKDLLESFLKAMDEPLMRVHSCGLWVQYPGKMTGQESGDGRKSRDYLRAETEKTVRFTV